MAEKNPYASPVDQFLLIGKLSDAETQNPREYIQQYGLTAADVPELARLMSDTSLWKLDEKNAASWAVIHALRALAQLQTDDAIQALLNFAELPKEGTWVEDWLWEELPEAFERVGVRALPALEPLVSKTSPAQLTLLECIEHIAQDDPEAKPACVRIILDLLANAPTNEPHFNGFLIAALIEMEVASEHLDAIEKAYATDNVDPTITGDWDDVQVELGLKEADPNKVRPSPFGGFFQDTLLSDSPMGKRPAPVINRTKADKKEKKKRKDAKKARKKNRKK